MQTPNIFNYATSELSQDAVICYILEWAKIENKDFNGDLHNLAIKFLDSLFDKFDDIEKPLKYKKIDIKKQYKNIDILCIINNEYSIIIEDKTNTKNHSDQLKRYFDIVNQKFEDTKILPIYFKTGDQSNYENVKKNGYKIYLRNNFLEVLNFYNIKNDIVENYTDYLQNIEDSIKSYKVLAIQDWHWNSWKGFFIKLRKKLQDGNWDYVSNPKGGFLGFWWNKNSSNNKYRVYLQIETEYIKEKKYTAKIKIKLQTITGNKIEKSILNKWKKHIIHNEDSLVVKKPKVVKTGKSVTIGILENEFRITDKNNIINMDKTVEFIKKIEEIKSSKFKTLELK